MDDALGLLLLVFYIVAILGISSAVTYAVVRIFPTERNPKKPDGSDGSSPPRGDESAGGRLFRRSKRATT